MGAKFSSELVAQDSVLSLKLRGVVDEDNELAGIESQLSAGITVLDLADIERINSCGVRDWVNWLGRIEKIGVRLVFVNCSPSIVAQMNLVHNFTAGGIVKSFYAPYFCPRCNKERLLKLETEELVRDVPITSAPPCRCDDCDGPMDFDDMEESYFAFMNNIRKVMDLPATAEALLLVSQMSESGAKQKTRGSVIGTTPATGPGNTPPTQAPSSISPQPKTPTGRPLTTAPATGLPSGSARLAGDGPTVSSESNRPIQPVGAPATVLATSTGTALAERPVGPMVSAQPSAARAVLTWVSVAAFFIAAIGAMIYAIAK